ncbi:MAG: hypothetical protein J6R91_05655 [Bacteroidaceae bacterium]|nr:hypothetical protein [Bacteroidaceae bacterium]
MEYIKTTKTIRFKLQHGHENKRIVKTISNLQNEEFDLAEFIVNLKQFIDLFYKFIFYKKDGDDYLQEHMTLKTEWLKKYARHKIKVSTTAKRQQHSIKKYKVDDIIKETLYNMEILYGELAKDASAELNERAKRARTGLLLKSLYAKHNLPCLVDLADNIVDKKETTNRSLRLKKMGRDLLQQLEAGMKIYLPEQSKGAVIAKASFNYYTLNKKPIDFQQKINELEHSLYTCLGDCRRDIHCNMNLWNAITNDINERTDGKQLCWGDSPFLEEGTYVSLRQTLKNILAEQKAAFSEMMQDDASYKELRESDLYLFRGISRKEFDDYKDLTNEIEDIATKKNQTSNDNRKKYLQTQLNNLKKQRGSLISAADYCTKNLFTDYKAFAAWYRDVAKKHGKIFAQLKGIEKERVDSQLLQYWAFMAEQNGQHQLYLVPREEAKGCYDFLKNATSSEASAACYWLESFTYRSLQKLCFGNLESGSNDFYREIGRELLQYTTLDCRGYPQFISGEYKFHGDEQKKIKFYQDVLASKSASKIIGLPQQELKKKVTDRAFSCLDDFKIALEQVCYRRFMRMSPNILTTIKERFNAQVFEITSLDLRNAENIKEYEKCFEHHDKLHTTIWKQFWSNDNANNHFDIRINPELSIIYRTPKDSRVEKYGVDSERYDERKKNRYLHEQLTLALTISEHCNAPFVNQAFSKVEEVVNNIKNFNQKLNDHHYKFALGIDNGEVELSTLGVYLPEFAKSSHEEVLEALRQVDKYGFEVLTITDLSYEESDTNGKSRRILQNPSYFLNPDLYCRTFGKSATEYEEMFERIFEKRHTLSLDLSTAKVICGHIVTNGDVTSLFNLWLRHAQRNVYEMNDHAHKEGVKNIALKKSDNLNNGERRKFIDYLAEKSEDYKKMTEAQKNEYVAWVYKRWNFEDVTPDSVFVRILNKHRVRGNYLHDVLMAVAFEGEELVSVSEIFNIRNVFKLRKDFYRVKSQDDILAEINAYNKRIISNEELDLKLNQLKSSLVANVVGVIDFLYKDYQSRYGGEGLVAMEDFNVKNVDAAMEKFAGNIYRMLERKLYLKLQNYGLVPPVKNLLQVRDNNKLKQIGNVCFVDEAGTSQMCPVCEAGRLGHTETCSRNCGFTSVGILHSNDGIAGYNIAKKGWNMNKY